MTSQRERTVAEMTHAQPWLPSPTADPHSRDCYMNSSYSVHNTQSRLPVNDNDVITLGDTIGTFEAVVFLSLFLRHLVVRMVRVLPHAWCRDSPLPIVVCVYSNIAVWTSIAQSV